MILGNLGNTHWIGSVMKSSTSNIEVPWPCMTFRDIPMNYFSWTLRFNRFSLVGFRFMSSTHVSTFLCSMDITPLVTAEVDVHITSSSWDHTSYNIGIETTQAEPIHQWNVFHGIQLLKDMSHLSGSKHKTHNLGWYVPKFYPPYIGDGHPAFNLEFLYWVYKPLLLGWWSPPQNDNWMTPIKVLSF